MEQPKVISSDCFNCFSCANITNDEDCSKVTQCSANEICYVERHGHDNTTKFTLGCMSSQLCPSQRPFSIVGRAINDRCFECCGSDGCNREMCEVIEIPVVPTVRHCDDDPLTNCSRMSTLVNICSKRDEARQLCPKFCGLCNQVHGQWSPWDDWTPCSSSCGPGLTHRRRACTNPRPSFNGNYCFGDPTEYSMCLVKKCPVDGGWREWSRWTGCSVTCGAGQMTRQRFCLDPRPENGGHNCTGSSIEQMACQHDPCYGPIPTIVFNAHTLATTSPTNGQILAFSTVLANIGGAYSSTTGKFTAPMNGTYSFTVQLCTYTAGGSFSLRLDGNYVTRLFFHTYGDVSTPSSTVPLFLTKGQMVWVQSNGCSNCLYQSSNCWSRFSGSLIHN